MIDELINLLREIRPNYGDVGSRDVDVRKRQKQIDRAIELLARQPAAIDKEAVGEIAHDEVNGFHFAPSVHWLTIGIGTKLYAAPLDKGASKPKRRDESWLDAVHGKPAAPSVEQDERGASWAPERIWLQRGIGEEGSHTWCEDSIDDCEQAEYVRVAAQSASGDTQ